MPAFVREPSCIFFWPTGAQHLAEVIRPALEAEQIVLCDRYSDSHNRLSGYGGANDVERLVLLNTLATDGLEPDWTILLDLPVQNGLKRAGNRNHEERARKFRKAVLIQKPEIPLNGCAWATWHCQGPIPNSFAIISALPEPGKWRKRAWQPLSKGMA